MAAMENAFTLYFESPLGAIEINGTEDAVTKVNFRESMGESSEQLPDIMLQCKKELEEYFAGTRTSFSLNLQPKGTGFQHQVWDQLQKVQFGNTASYMDIAKRLNNPEAVRAVGLANGKNPIAIIIPCHRIIGGNGSLTGYAGGMWRKQWLLEHEGNVSGRNPTLF